MSGYVEPEYSRDQLVDADDCFARAQRALERAELAVDEVAEMVAGNDDATSLQEQMEIAQMRALIGSSWAELGAALDAQRRGSR